MLTKVCSKLNRCIENRVRYEYGSRNKDATAHVGRNLFRAHARHSLGITVKVVETIAHYHHLQIFGLKIVYLVTEKKRPIPLLLVVFWESVKLED